MWRTTLTGFLAVAASLVLIGCGSDRTVGVTAPSAIAAPAVSAATTNRVVAFDHGNDGEPVDGEAPVTSLVAGTSCPALSFMIAEFTISVTTTTTYERGTCADIKPGARLEVKGTKTGTAVAASAIEFKDGGANSGPGGPHRTEPVGGEGVVTSLVAGTSCPTLQFKIGSFLIMLDATTTFERGTCADVKVGAKLEVSGAMDSVDRSITATRVEFRNNNADENEPAEGEGIVTSLVTGTSCPALQFMIDTFLVKLDATTVFDKGSCADIKVGSRVHVKGGLNRTTSSVVATRIAVQTEAPGHPEAEGEARVTSLVSGTSCPTLTFKVDEWTVMTTASTVFTAGTCADLAAGKKVGVKGIVTAEHQVQATQIVFKTED